MVRYCSCQVHLDSPCSDKVRTKLTEFRKGKIDERFKTTYDKLYEIRNQLERLSLTQAWSLRETDLYNYQRQLDRVDESRINGNFEDPTGYKADLHAQRVGHPLQQNTCTEPHRLCFTSFVVAMHTSTAWLYRRSPFPRHFYPFSISSRLFADVYWKSGSPEESLRRGNFTLTVWRYALRNTVKSWHYYPRPFRSADKFS